MQLVDNNDYEVYIGETKRSHRTTLCHGRGVKVVINEVIYQGWFMDNDIAPDTVLRVIGSMGYYEGTHLKGVEHGQGCYKWVNGEEYTGEWSHGQMNGEGIYKHLDCTYEGQFKKGQRSGRGKVTLKTGVQEEGKWSNGKKDGQFKVVMVDGSLLEQTWIDGNMIKEKRLC